MRMASFPCNNVAFERGLVRLMNFQKLSLKSLAVLNGAVAVAKIKSAFRTWVHIDTKVTKNDGGS